MGDTDPQAALNTASPGETIVGDPSETHVIDEPVTITTPRVTVRGLSLRLEDESDESLIEIGADGVHLTDFILDGNRENQAGDRQSNGVLVTGAQNVSISNGYISHVSRHGLRIVDASDVTSFAPGDTIHVDRGPVAAVTVRDVRIDNPRRDGCSIEGPDLEHVSVESVRTSNSSDRGSVEVKDGASNVSVTDCYAEQCSYGVAVQDHGQYPSSNIRLAGNSARHCETLIDAQTSHSPENVIITGNIGWNLGGDGMGGHGGIYANLIAGLIVTNNILEGVSNSAIVVENCTEVLLTDNLVRESLGPGIEISGTDQLTASRNGIAESADNALTYHGGDNGSMAVQITDSRYDGDVRLAGSIDRYLVTDNLVNGSIIDDSEGHGRLHGNLQS